MQANNTQNLDLFKHQVSGKAPKLITADNRTVLKCYTHEEYLFYQYFKNQIHASLPQYSLVKFMPQYEGLIVLDSKPNINSEVSQNKEIKIWLQHVKHRYDAKNQGNKFILMRNFLHGYSHPNILDIKTGGRQGKFKPIMKSVVKYKLKLNGMFKTSYNGENQFISKYILNPICEFQQLCKYVAYFFKANGQLRTDLMSVIVEQLKDLVLTLRSLRQWKLLSTSICIVYNSGDGDARVQLKYIDFGRAIKNELADQGTYDTVTVMGIQNVIVFMQHILDNPKQYEQVQVQKSEQQVVPKVKVAKFSSRQVNNEQKSA